MSATPDEFEVLDELLEGDPVENARTLEAMLASVPGGDRGAVDARVVRMLENRSLGDGLLEHLELDTLRNLCERVISQQSPGLPAADDSLRWEAWTLLDVLRRSPLLVRISEAGAVDEWADVILRLVESSHFTFGPLFEQRVAGYGSRTLFVLPAIGDGRTIIQDLGAGTASYYGRRFHGRLTANGETFDMNALTAAHRTLPFGSMVRVTNPGNGRSVTVRINDRGPFVGDRVIDLSRAAAEQIGLIQPGHAEVRLALVEG